MKMLYSVCTLPNLNIQLLAVWSSLCKSACLQHKLLNAVVCDCAMQLHVTGDTGNTARNVF